MKINKQTLQKLIKEELEGVLAEEFELSDLNPLMWDVEKKHGQGPFSYKFKKRKKARGIPSWEETKKYFTETPELERKSPRISRQQMIDAYETPYIIRPGELRKGVTEVPAIGQLFKKDKEGNFAPPEVPYYTKRQFFGSDPRGTQLTMHRAGTDPRDSVDKYYDEESGRYIWDYDPSVEGGEWLQRIGDDYGDWRWNPKWNQEMLDPNLTSKQRKEAYDEYQEYIASLGYPGYEPPAEGTWAIGYDDPERFDYEEYEFFARDPDLQDIGVQGPARRVYRGHGPHREGDREGRTVRRAREYLPFNPPRRVTKDPRTLVGQKGRPKKETPKERRETEYVRAVTPKSVGKTMRDIVRKEKK